MLTLLHRLVAEHADAAPKPLVHLQDAGRPSVSMWTCLELSSSLCQATADANRQIGGGEGVCQGQKSLTGVTDCPSTLTGSHPSLSPHIVSCERLGSHDRRDTCQSDGRGRTAASTDPHAPNPLHYSAPRSSFLLVLHADSAGVSQDAARPNNQRD